MPIECFLHNLSAAWFWGNESVETVVAMTALIVGAVASWVVRDWTLVQQIRKSKINRAGAIEKVESLQNELQAEKVARVTAEAIASRATLLETELAKLRSAEQQLIREKAELETAAARVSGLQADLDAERTKVEQLTAEKSRLETEVAAMKQHVIITMPTKLNALAKVVAFGWKKVTESGSRIAARGRDLRRRLRTMGKDMMPPARKYSEKKVEGTQDSPQSRRPTMHRYSRAVRSASIENS
jgi:chromosome segregation ATPase